MMLQLDFHWKFWSRTFYVEHYIILFILLCKVSLKHFIFYLTNVALRHRVNSFCDWLQYVDCLFSNWWENKLVESEKLMNRKFFRRVRCRLVLQKYTTEFIGPNVQTITKNMIIIDNELCHTNHQPQTPCYGKYKHNIKVYGIFPLKQPTNQISADISQTNTTKDVTNELL